MATDLERELERTTALRGFRYGLHDFVAAVGGAEALKPHVQGGVVHGGEFCSVAAP
jgi:hypothetical protein